jgi:hypothetical protein
MYVVGDNIQTLANYLATEDAAAGAEALTLVFSIFFSIFFAGAATVVDGAAVVAEVALTGTATVSAAKEVRAAEAKTIAINVFI